MNTPSGFQTVIEHFKRKGWKFQLDAERPILHAGFKGRSGSFRCVVMVEPGDDLVQALTFVGVVVPPGRRGAVAELCNRLSYGMKMGRFELDHSDGEVRFHTSSAFPKGELDDAVVERVVGLNIVVMDRNFPAFVGVLYGNVEPADAASRIRSGLENVAQGATEPEVHSRARVMFN